MEENSEDLFGIRLNETARKYIVKSARIVGFAMVLTIASSLIALVGHVVKISTVFENKTFNSSYAKPYVIADFLSVFGLVLNIFSIIKYYSFVSSLNRSIKNENEAGFSHSFRHMFTNAVFFLIVILLNILATGIYLFASF
jgi:hypothetical protein